MRRLRVLSASFLAGVVMVLAFMAGGALATTYVGGGFAAPLSVTLGGTGTTAYNIGTAVNSANVVNGTAASGRLTWTTGGTYAAGPTSQIYGNTDGTFFISPGAATASVGNGITLTGSNGFLNSFRGGGAITLTGGRCDSGGLGSFGASLTVNGGSDTGDGISGSLVAQGGNASGTNVDAGGAVFSSGLPTGTGTSDLAFKTGFKIASGASSQSSYDRQRITSKTKALSTTTNNNTVFCNLAVATSDSGGGCTVDGLIELIDGSHHVGCIAFSATWSAVNQNGTLTTGVVPTLATSNGSIATGGTYTSLTTTFTAAASGTNLQLGVTPTWAAGTPTTVRLTYQIRANGQCTISPQ